MAKTPTRRIGSRVDRVGDGPISRYARLGLVTDLTDAGAAVDQAVAVASDIAAADTGAVELTKRLIASVEAPALATFQPFELAVATVAQQRSAAASGRAPFG